MVALAVSGGALLNLLSMRGISKSFGPVQALDRVTFEVNKGEVVGLVGDNAAGKSTLMKILTGAYQADRGQIFWNKGMTVPYPGGGRAEVLEHVEFHSPEDSRRAGIEMVYQDLALVDCLDVAANVYLGREIADSWPLGLLNKREMRWRTEELLRGLNIEVKNPSEIVGNLSGGQRQAVAIARAVAFGAKLVILDEPTASLSIPAIGRVQELISRLKVRGVSVILISHRIDDILDACGSACVLYQGRISLESDLTRNDRAWNRNWLIRAMEGRTVEV